MYAGNRFSLGWYVARIDSLVASGIVLSVLVGSLMALTAQLTARSEALSQLAYHDALTGIANKRAFDAALLREWDRSSRERRPIALLMCDVDFFKGYNDSLGHLAGRPRAARSGRHPRAASVAPRRHRGQVRRRKSSSCCWPRPTKTAR